MTRRDELDDFLAPPHLVALSVNAIVSSRFFPFWFMSFVFRSILSEWGKCIFTIFVSRYAVRFLLVYINNVSCIEVFFFHSSMRWHDLFSSFSFSIERFCFSLILFLLPVWNSFVREQFTCATMLLFAYRCSVYVDHLFLHITLRRIRYIAKRQVRKVWEKLVQIWWTHVHIEIHKFWRDSDSEVVFAIHIDILLQMLLLFFFYFGYHLFIKCSSLVVNQYHRNRIDALSNWMSWSKQIKLASVCVCVFECEGWNLLRKCASVRNVSLLAGQAIILNAFMLFKSSQKSSNMILREVTIAKRVTDIQTINMQYNIYMYGRSKSLNVIGQHWSNRNITDCPIHTHTL